jgi:hypothetical protein
VLIFVALAVAYPEHKWRVPHRHYKPHGYWKDVDNQRKFLDQLASKLNIQRPEDWYSVPSATIFKEGGNFVYTIYKGLVPGK